MCMQGVLWMCAYGHDQSPKTQIITGGYKWEMRYNQSRVKRGNWFLITQRQRLRSAAQQLPESRCGRWRGKLLRFSNVAIILAAAATSTAIRSSAVLITRAKTGLTVKAVVKHSHTTAQTHPLRAVKGRGGERRVLLRSLLGNVLVPRTALFLWLVWVSAREKVAKFAFLFFFCVLCHPVLSMHTT